MSDASASFYHSFAWPCDLVTAIELYAVRQRDRSQREEKREKERETKREREREKEKKREMSRWRREGRKK